MADRIRRTAVSLVATAAMLVAACTGDGAESPPPPTTQAPGAEPAEVVLMTHDSFAISDEVLADFTNETGIGVKILRAGDAGTMVNQAVLTKDDPLADVMFGVDNTFLSRALTEELFEEYRSPELAAVPAELQLDATGRATPIDFGDVCLNYDKAVFADLGLDVPGTLLDLTDSDYRGLLVVENPATSSPGLAFLMATVATFGEQGAYTWLDFWADLRDNDVLVTAGWEEAYRSWFTPYGGDRPLVVSYASSPPAEVIFADPPVDESPTGVIVGGCFRQIEFAGILAGTEARSASERFVDFMLGLRFQEDIPLNMFVFPANSNAALPVEFVEHTVVSEDPLLVEPAVIDANRERWISEWTEVVLP